MPFSPNPHPHFDIIVSTPLYSDMNVHLCDMCALYANALCYVAVPPGPPTDILVSTTATEAYVTWKAPLFIGELFSKDDLIVCQVYCMAEEFCGRKYRQA